MNLDCCSRHTSIPRKEGVNQQQQQQVSRWRFHKEPDWMEVGDRDRVEESVPVLTIEFFSLEKSELFETNLSIVTAAIDNYG